MTGLSPVRLAIIKENDRGQVPYTGYGVVDDWMQRADKDRRELLAERERLVALVDEVQQGINAAVQQIVDLKGENRRLSDELASLKAR